jgi:hypothetical protein
MALALSLALAAGAGAARTSSGAEAAGAESVGLSPVEALALCQKLAADVGPLMEASRPVLIGTRKTPGSGATCLMSFSDGTPQSRIDAEGGPGSKIKQRYASDLTHRAPTEDLRWYQTEFKGIIESLRRENGRVLPRALRFAEESERLAAAIRTWKDVPPGFTAAETSLPPGHWPG